MGNDRLDKMTTEQALNDLKEACEKFKEALKQELTIRLTPVLDFLSKRINR